MIKAIATLSLEKKLMLIFILTCLVLFGWFNMTKPTILVLHSYDKSYAWTRDINIGLNRVLKQKELYQVRWYYMDTKRHPFPSYRTSAGIAARHVIEETKPDVLIAVDDDAQAFAAKYFINHPSIKIIYAGINNTEKDYGYEKANNATGILERIPLSAMKDAFQSERNLQKLTHPIRVAYLGDTSATVMGDAEQIKDFNWAPLQLIGIYNEKLWKDWQARVVQLGETADVIIVTGYRQLVVSSEDKKPIPYKDVVAWTEANSKIPVISGNGFFPEDGGMLAIGTSPFEQGEVAARYALKIILEHKPISEIPMTKSQQFIVTMSEEKIKARKFELPKVYEAAARIGDKYFP